MATALRPFARPFQNILPLGFAPEPLEKEYSVRRTQAKVFAAENVAGLSTKHQAVYGSLAAFARQLGLSDAASLLEETLQEEKSADAKLSQLGENLVNTQATQGRRAA